MGLKGLNSFQHFDLDEFLRDKCLVFLKAISWIDEGREIGSKVILQIFEDNTVYQKPDTNNSGEQITIKVRSFSPTSFKFKPLSTEMAVTDVERAFIYGEYRNQLSIIASVSVKGS